MWQPRETANLRLTNGALPLRAISGPQYYKLKVHPCGTLHKSPNFQCHHASLLLIRKVMAIWIVAGAV